MSNSPLRKFLVQPKVMRKVLVILISINRAKYLREVVDNVVAETFTDFEPILLSSAPSDNPVA
jgi:glycosyltransferase involved in cell wall biosynthesis